MADYRADFYGEERYDAGSDPKLVQQTIQAPRHTWQEVSRSVNTCSRCGLLRVRKGTQNNWSYGRPVVDEQKMWFRCWTWTKNAYGCFGSVWMR